MLSASTHALFLLVVLNGVMAPALADVYTSMALIKKMVKNEMNILLATKNNIPGNIRESNTFVKFYEERLVTLAERNLTMEIQRLQHPNAVFLVLQEFARNYGDRLKTGADVQRPQVKHLTLVANSEDVKGAIVALLRLQEVYSLNARDMVEGKYVNIKGPPLSHLDSYQVGREAFNYGKYHQSIHWLKVSADLKSVQLKSEEEEGPDHNISLPHISALLGRAVLRTGNRGIAENIYKAWETKGSDEEEMATFASELKNEPKVEGENTGPELKDLHRLCATHGIQPEKPQNPRLRCRYRGRVPYFRYQEEVLNEAPYISVFYGVITDREIKKVKRLSITKMTRAAVVTPTGMHSSFTRTSQLAFLSDDVSDTVQEISRRVGYVTGLDTSVSDQGFLSPSQSSSEPVQVVNYGIGGHFSLHRDPLQFYNKITSNILTYSGNRIATFLIYLGDVTVGGYTAFPKLDLIVHPLKGSAVFWYNYSPSGEQEEMTWHAGCPVVIGDKWIINKWILSYGNTFVRRCGRSKGATQLDIEEDMISGYR